MNRFYPLLVLIATVVAACQSSDKPAAEPVAPVAKDTVMSEIEVAPDETGEREPTDDEIGEFGIVKHLEDAGYPIFIVTMEFPERQTTADFLLNVEASSLEYDEWLKLQGSYATIYYTSEDEVNVLDIEAEGKTLLGEYAPDDHEGLTAFTGILHGADEPTPGDLPGLFSVTNAKDEEVEFEYYATEAEVLWNEKEVTIYYTMQGRERITYVSPSEN